MLHGAENYPESIGRDLDCLCETPGDTSAALSCFEQAAREHPETKWVVFPHPIWGRRCVAISASYESAELHILPGLSSGPMSHQVEYDKIDYSVPFPQEDAAFYLKSIVMPLLGNSAKVSKSIAAYGEEKLPDCILTAHNSLQEHGSISLRERLMIYYKHMESLPGAARGVLHALKNKVWRYFAKTVPVFYLSADYTQAEIDGIARALSEPFIKFVDCSALSLQTVRRLQSQQYFLYSRRAGHPKDAIDTQGRRSGELYDYIIECFSHST